MKSKRCSFDLTIQSALNFIDYSYWHDQRIYLTIKKIVQVICYNNECM